MKYVKCQDFCLAMQHNVSQRNGFAMVDKTVQVVVMKPAVVCLINYIFMSHDLTAFYTAFFYTLTYLAIVFNVLLWRALVIFSSNTASHYNKHAYHIYNHRKTLRTTKDPYNMCTIMRRKVPQLRTM